MRCSHSYTLNKKCLQFASEHVHCPAQRLMFGVQQEDCFTNAVPGQRNCGRRSSSWCGEQPVDQRLSTTAINY